MCLFELRRENIFSYTHLSISCGLALSTCPEPQFPLLQYRERQHLLQGARNRRVTQVCCLQSFLDHRKSFCQWQQLFIYYFYLIYRNPFLQCSKVDTVVQIQSGKAWWIGSVAGGVPHRFSPSLTRHQSLKSPVTLTQIQFLADC